jgi:hypothetical protein
MDLCITENPTLDACDFDQEKMTGNRKTGKTN